MSDNIYKITYLDKYEQPHTVEMPAPNVEYAIAALEDGLHEEVEVSKIEIVD